MLDGEKEFVNIPLDIGDEHFLRTKQFLVDV